jgi:hypothetical protein
LKSGKSIGMKTSGAAFPCRGSQLQQHPDRARPDAQRFDQPSDRELREIAQQLGARALQPGPAETKDFDVGHAPAQLGGEGSGVQIAGGFAARDHDPQAKRGG